MTRLPGVRVYRVRSVFLTLQGEGVWTGARAVFVRFTACNVWTGQERDRERDTKKGFCAAWCDTEFRDTEGPGGGVFTASELTERVEAMWAHESKGDRLVVLSGGEPSLQVDEALVDALHRRGFRVHMETNGSRERPDNLDWITLSPKPPMVVLVDGKPFDELKVVLAPGVDPEDYAHVTSGPRWIQPCDYGNPNDSRTIESERAAIEYALTHPGWRLGLQTHKVSKLP